MRVPYPPLINTPALNPVITTRSISQFNAIPNFIPEYTVAGGVTLPAVVVSTLYVGLLPAMGVNKAVGKHYWEVFCDEGRDINDLVSTTMRGQTEAAGDFDIEWGRNPTEFAWRQQQLQEFRTWLERNGFDPDDPELTIGHPRIGQVDLERSFGTQDHAHIIAVLANYTDVVEVRSSDARAEYPYHWSDNDYQQRQIQEIAQRRKQ